MTNAELARGRRTWIRRPMAILAKDASEGLVIEGTRIVECIATGSMPTQPVDEVFDATNHVVIPGLINTHHHFFQNLTRAHPHAQNKALFPWLAALYPVWAHLTPEAFRIATRLSYVELLLSGCTTAADHHYLYPAGLEAAVDIQVEEARALQMRAIVSRGSMSTGSGGVTPSDLVQTEQEILADSERVLDKYHDRSDGAMIQIALAPCSLFNVTKELMVQTATLADRYDCQIHTHCGETLDEISYCESTYRQRPIQYLEEVGWLNPRTWLAHGIHFTSGEISKLGKAAVGISHCPTSNMVLGSGQCRTRELEAAGCDIGIGVDGSASNDSSNLMEAIRHALMVNRLTYGPESISHLDALRWATEGAARSVGRTDIGRLEPGCEADLAMFNLDELRFSGAHDPLAALVLCGAHQADRVMIAGRWKVIDKHPVGVDLLALRAEHAASTTRFAATI